MSNTPLPRPVAEVLDGVLEATIVGSFTRLGFGARRRLFAWPPTPTDALVGRVALVTGGTSGLGLAAARGLARAGATVVVSGRDPDRTEQARTAITQAAGRDDVHTINGDLGRLSDVRSMADELAHTHDRLDVVVHNAGTLVHEHTRTADGLEVTAQVHVVAPFLLTALLQPQLADGGGGRVITVTSGGMYSAALDVAALADPPHGDDFDGVRAYAQAKRAQVVLTGQWATRAAGSGVTHLAMHPGWADTAGLAASLPHFHRLVGPVLRTPDQGVDTTVWLAHADDPLAHPGTLWLDRHRRRTVYVPGTGTDDAEADRLWQWCVASAHIDDPAPGPVRSPRSVPDP